MLRLFRKVAPIKLGRWGNKKPMTKVDFANSDHCGTCVYHAQDEFDSSMEISLCALQSMHSYPKREETDAVDTYADK